MVKKLMVFLSYKSRHNTNYINMWLHLLYPNDFILLQEAVTAIALCHNVTPVYESDFDDPGSPMESQSEADQQFWGRNKEVQYQASSPDEVSYFILMSSA